MQKLEHDIETNKKESDAKLERFVQLQVASVEKLDNKIEQSQV